MVWRKQYRPFLKKLKRTLEMKTQRLNVLCNSSDAGLFPRQALPNTKSIFFVALIF